MTDIENPSLFQRLVNTDEVGKMIAELKNLDRLAPEDTDPEEVDQWELAVSFRREDVPAILDELRELRDE
jgi:hypothetical protein